MSYFLVPLTVCTTFRAAFFTLLPSPLPLAGLGFSVVLFTWEAGMRALTGVFVGAFLGAFLAAGWRGDFAEGFWALAGAREWPPRAAAAKICFLVSADGRLS